MTEGGLVVLYCSHDGGWAIGTVVYPMMEGGLVVQNCTYDGGWAGGTVLYWAGGENESKNLL